MTLKRKAAEAAGWYGTLAIVSAYALVSFDVIQPDGWAFQLLNLSGALGILIISAIKNVRQSVALNAFWFMIAAIALIRLAIL